MLCESSPLFGPMWILRSPSESVNVTCIPVNEKAFTIGRIGNGLIYCHFPLKMCLECDLNVCDDKSVSRRHAELKFNASGFPVLSDLSSKFGTFVNGRKLDAATALRSGDSIKFGGAGSDFM